MTRARRKVVYRVYVNGRRTGITFNENEYAHLSVSTRREVAPTPRAASRKKARKPYKCVWCDFTEPYAAGGLARLYAHQHDCDKAPMQEIAKKARKR